MSDIISAPDDKPVISVAQINSMLELAVKNQGMFLIDGKWKFFNCKLLKDLLWSDIRDFLRKNYSTKAIDNMGIYLDARRKQTRMDKDANTLFRGDDAIVGMAEIPAKLLRALQNDFQEEFGFAGDLCDPNDMLKIFERHSVLNCFVITPTQSRNLDV